MCPHTLTRHNYGIFAALTFISLFGYKRNCEGAGSFETLLSRQDESGGFFDILLIFSVKGLRRIDLRMPRIRLVLQYDGSNYHGFQRQENALTVQEIVEKAIHKLSGEKAGIICAGRTDAGVHATGQVVAFNSTATIPGERWKMALNSFLPDDIQVLKSSVAHPDFNPRFDAISKKYVYRIFRRERGSIFYRNYALCLHSDLNLQAMEQAGQMIIGRHNFTAFCARGSSAKTFERTILELSFQVKGPLLSMSIEADGFLYNMVRIVMGTLLEVGRGRHEPKWVNEVIKSRDRTKAGLTAPPQGLYLVRVNYPEEKLHP